MEEQKISEEQMKDMLNFNNELTGLMAKYNVQLKPTIEIKIVPLPPRQSQAKEVINAIKSKNEETENTIKEETRAKQASE